MKKQKNIQIVLWLDLCFFVLCALYLMGSVQSGDRKILLHYTQLYFQLQNHNII